MKSIKIETAKRINKKNIDLGPGQYDRKYFNPLWQKVVAMQTNEVVTVEVDSKPGVALLKKYVEKEFGKGLYKCRQRKQHDKYLAIIEKEG